MRNAFLAIVSLALVIPSRCYGPQTHQGSESDVNAISYSTGVNDYGVVNNAGDASSPETLSIFSTPETPAPSVPAARYWWQNVDSPFLKDGQPSIVPVSSTNAPASPVELNIVSDAGTTGVRVPNPDHGITEVRYPNNPFLNGEVDRKTKVHSVAPTVFTSTVAPTVGTRDYSNPGIEPLYSNSIGKLKIGRD